MSELTACNCCTLKRIRAEAKRAGKKVQLKADPFHTWGGGTAVYVDGERVAWLAEVPKKCEC